MQLAHPGTSLFTLVLFHSFSLRLLVFCCVLISSSSYFQRWYEALSSDTKRHFKELVHNGQVEFVNGGWVQHDEANPDPTAMINQMTVGHEYLMKNFGVAPRVAWQIDPFGHSGKNRLSKSIIQLTDSSLFSCDSWHIFPIYIMLLILFILCLML
jgi:hypothetical protein